MRIRVDSRGDGVAMLLWSTGVNNELRQACPSRGSKGGDTSSWVVRCHSVLIEAPIEPGLAGGLWWDVTRLCLACQRETAIGPMLSAVRLAAWTCHSTGIILGIDIHLSG
jgi:hypothetical protein